VWFGKAHLQRSTFLAGAAAASFFPSRLRAQTLTKVSLAGTVNEDILGVLWAVQSGIFQRLGLDVDVQHSSNGAAVSAAVVSGALDIGKSSIIPLLTAHARGVPFVVEAPGGVYTAADPNAALVVGKDSPLRGGGDFNGKTLAVPALSDLFALGLSAWVDRNGGDSHTLKFLELPGPAQADAIAAGRIAGAMMVEPLVSDGVRAGKIRVLARAYDAIASHFAVTLFFTSADYAARNADVLARFRKALAEGVAFVTAHRAQTLPAYAQFSGIDPSVLAAMIPNHMGTSLDPQMIQPVIDVAVKYGVLGKPFSAKDLFDRNA
jgi:NitT/TauT family transport system substrate-binding protein